MYNDGDDEDEDGGEDGGDENASGRLPRDLVGMLAQVLHKAMNLEDLSIYPCEELLTRNRNAKLPEAIITLRHLRRFQMESIGVAAAEVLTTMTSRLVERDINHIHDDMREPDTLFFLATHHASTLERFSGEFVGLDNEVTTFPHVHSLTLRNSWELHDVPVLHKAFPGLRSLEISGPEGHEVHTAGTRQPIPPEASNHPWVLDRLCGAVNALYDLGGSPRAQSLEIYRIDSAQECLERLRTVISETHPTHLVLHFADGFGMNSGFFIKDIANLLPAEGIAITHLVLNLRTLYLKGTADEFTVSERASLLITCRCLMQGTQFALTALLRAHSLKFLMIRLELDHDTLNKDESEDDVATAGAREIINWLSRIPRTSSTASTKRIQRSLTSFWTSRATGTNLVNSPRQKWRAAAAAARAGAPKGDLRSCRVYALP